MGHVRDYIYETTAHGIEDLHRTTERALYLGLAFDVFQQEIKEYEQKRFLVKFFIQKKTTR